MPLPTVPFGSHSISRLTIGGNPFSGFSHQNPQRDREMLDYYTVDRIKQTLRDCEQAGINTCCLRVDAHIWRMLREYRNEGGKLQWFAQMGGESPTHEANINQAAANGALAYYIHGGVIDALYEAGNLDRVRQLVDLIHAKGMLAGLAGHNPEAHRWVYDAGVPADFHVVCFYNCGSVHAGKGERFDPADTPHAVEVIQHIQKPCIAYKVMGAGRRPWREALEYAYANIKPSDIVNLGMYTGDNPTMVQDNVELVCSLLGA